MRKLTLLILVLAMMIFVGCSKDDKESHQLDGVTDNVEDKVGPDEDANIFPLTGERTSENTDNRIISVMVNNHSKARPQSGLAEADIVFEILAEGGITRFLALYQSDLPDVVGPVRSAREYYFKLADGYDALYVYHGAIWFVDEMIVDQGINFLNGAIYDNDGHLFKREAFRQAPHNSYLQMDAVYDVAEDKGYETTFDYTALPFLDEDEITKIKGEKIEQLEITYNRNPVETVDYVFNSSTDQYERYSNGVQTVNLDEDVPVVMDNVLIMETYHEVIDDEGRRAIDFDSGGAAYLLQKGKIQQVEWENDQGRIIPIMDGEKVGLVPGKTWINVVPSLEQSVQIRQ